MARTDSPSGASEENELVISRVFDASRELVWRIWTEPEQVKRWWGPQYFTSPYCRIDLRVGGRYLFCMRSPDGKDYWSTGVYREIKSPERIVCTDCFADEKGNVVPATHYGLSTKFPLEMLVKVTFEAQENRTKFTLHHIGIPPGEDTDNTREGWSGSFDKLAEALRKGL